MSIQIKLSEKVNSRFKYIAKRAETELKQDKDSKIFIIVPEQFNFACQKLMFEELNKKVISQIEVLSFTRLIHRIYEEANYFKETISNIERLSIISNIIEENKSSLKFFGRYKITDKVIIEINSLMKLITKNVVEMNKLEEFHSQNEGILADKIHDVNIIFDEYKKKLKNINVDLDIITPLNEVCANVSMLDNASIYFSDFYNFTNEQINIIKILESYGAKITIVAQADESIKESSLSIYMPIKNIIEKLDVSDANIEYIEKTSFKDEVSREKCKSKELEFLIDAYSKKVEIKESSKDIFFNKYASRSEEVFNICLNINKLVREGYRYKDISVVIKNFDDYELKLKDYFNAFNIPFYVENKKKLSNTKMFRVILKVFGMINKNYNLEDVNTLLKECIIKNLEDKDIFIFENYYLEKGAEYLTTLKNIFEKECSEIDENKNNNNKLRCEDIESIRKVFSVIEEISNASKNMIRKTNSVSNYNEFICYLLENIFKDSFIENQNKEIEKIMNVLDKWSKCEEKTLDGTEFINKIKVLTEDVSISHMDEKIDKISIYDSGRVNFLKTKVLVLAGYSNGQLKLNKLTSLFSEKESEKLEKSEIEFNKNFKEQILEERFLFFNMLEKVNEKLIISYTMFEGDSKVDPANELNKLLSTFTNISRIEYDEDEIINDLLNTDDAIIKYIYQNIDEIEIKREAIKKALSRIKNKDVIKELFNFSKSDEINIEDDINELNLSFSAIEKYINCPFAYFMKYKLGIKERKILKFDALTVGNIAHEVFEKLFNHVIENKIDLKNWQEKDIIDNIDKILDEDLKTEFFRNEKNEATFNRLKEIIYRNANNFVIQLNNGKFNVCYNELEFGKNKEINGIEFETKDKVKVYLGGKIDRADVYEDENGENIYFKVIDYKTGNATFDIEKAREGINMQLLIYLKILLDKFKKEGKKAIPAGIFLAKVNSELKVDEEYSLEDNKLVGLVNSDESVQMLMDEDYKTSKILPIKYNKSSNTLHATSQKNVCNEIEFENLAEECLTKTKEIAEEIVKGNMNVKVEEDNNCKNCPYKNICNI